MKLPYLAGASALLLILIITAGCTIGGASDPCIGTSCGSAGPADPVAVPSAPAVHRVTDLSDLALARGDMPFPVTDEQSSGSIAGEDSQTSDQFGAFRGYQVMYAGEKTGSTGTGVIQMILEFPPGNASRYYDYAYSQFTHSASTGGFGTVTGNAGVGDRSFGFTLRSGYGSLPGTTPAGIIFVRENIVEILMMVSPGADSATLTPLAQKAAALVPAGGTTPPTASRAAIPEATAPAAAAAVTPGNVPAGLLVWYTFDDNFAANGYVTDMSGHGRTGVVTGGTVAAAPGIAGSQGILFNGRGYLQTSDNPAAGKKAVTWSFWFQTPDPTQNFKFASAAEWRGEPGTGWTMATHRPEFWADDGPEDLIVPAQPNADNCFVAGQWTHEVVVYDGKTMKEYTNGTLVNDWKGRSVPMSAGKPMAVGGWPQFSGYNYEGQMDDFRIYDRALTAGEISALYRDGRS